MATHSSVLALRIPTDRGAWATVHGVTKSQTCQGSPEPFSFPVMYLCQYMLFQVLKDDAVKVLHSICQQIWKTAVATGLEKVIFHSSLKERQCQRMFKLPHNCTHLTR